VIHHVQLACPAGSEDVLRAFYAGVLGLAEVAKPPVLAARGGCWFRGHGIELHLGVEQDFRPARKAHPGLLVRGLDDWAERLRAAGAPVRYDGDFPGMRRFYSEDPYGNRLEFLEPVAPPAGSTPAGTTPAGTTPAGTALAGAGPA
jgi:catechol 2,3-dioxygenase-like lactoylglutathione lyase family enzyme